MWGRTSCTVWWGADEIFIRLLYMDDLWEDAYICLVNVMDCTTKSAIYIMELTVMGWVPILGSAARNTDWRIFIDTILRLLYTKPTSKSQTNNSYDYEAFIIVIILTTFLSADPKPDIRSRIWSQNSVPVRQEIPFWWTIQCMKILILITVSTVAFLWKNLLRALKNTTHSIIIKGEYDWTQTMRKFNSILHLMRHCRSNLEKKQSI